MSDSVPTLLTVKLTEEEFQCAYAMAKRAEIGGRSNVRSAKERRQTLGVDQLTGQLGQIAFHRYWYGTTLFYLISRWHQDRTPFIGDGGSDLSALNLDVKTSQLNGMPDPGDLHLLVRPTERHIGWVYVLGGVETDNRTVHFVGWLANHELPGEASEDPRFEGAYAVAGHDLHPLPPLQFLWGTWADRVRGGTIRFPPNEHLQDFLATDEGRSIQRKLSGMEEGEQ